jgi:PAS domain S-box-containing protein
MRILVADDHDQNRHLLETLLGGLGHEVASAPNGREALALLKGGGFGAVVSDIGMPEMDGFELCRDVRADTDLQGLPFVFYAATYSAGKDAKTAYALGADGFLLKPMETEAFVQRFFELIRTAAANPDRAQAMATVFERRMLPRSGQGSNETSMTRNNHPERVLAEVRDCETRLQEIFQQTGDLVVVFLIGPDGGVSFERINPAAERIWGLRNERAQGKTTKEVLCAERAVFVNGLVGRVLASGEPVEVDDSIAVGGQALVFSALYSPIRNGQGSLCRVVCTGRDVTAKRRAAEHQRRLEERLFESRKMEALGRLAGGVAHDFNNLIGAIMGNAELVSMDLPPEHPAGVFMAEIHRATRRARDLAQQILSLSHRSQRLRHPVDLVAAVKDTLETLRTTVPPDAMLVVDLDEACPLILAEGAQIRQMVANLLAHAVQSIPNTGGRITVSLREMSMAPEETGRLDGHGSERRVCLSVADNGDGMDQTSARQVFDPFFVLKEPGRGAGLGLAIVRSIVEDYSGTVSVESTPGNGARFDVRFPVCPESITAFKPALGVK